MYIIGKDVIGIYNIISTGNKKIISLIRIIKDNCIIIYRFIFIYYIFMIIIMYRLFRYIDTMESIFFFFGILCGIIMYFIL